MIIREVQLEDVDQLIDLYMNHLTKYPPKTPQSTSDWVCMLEEIIEKKDYHLIVGLVDEVIVSSVTLVVIRNLTHNLRPYSVMENVVTHDGHRQKGYASKLIAYASDIAENQSCYKTMLMTGSKRESTLNFYRENGFTVGEKTACLKRFR